MKKVICISGKAQHGKDTSATILKSILEERGNKVLIIHYADLLKYLCKEYFGWNGSKDDEGRTLLQHVGTDVVRNKQPDYWVNFVVEFLKIFETEWDYVIIPDCRFPNEVSTITKYFNTKHIRIIRQNFNSPLSIEQQQHPSETALDNYSYDYVVYNDSSVLNLGIRLIELATQLDC